MVRFTILIIYFGSSNMLSISQFFFFLYIHNEECSSLYVLSKFFYTFKPFIWNKSSGIVVSKEVILYIFLKVY